MVWNCLECYYCLWILCLIFSLDLSLSVFSVSIDSLRVLGNKFIFWEKKLLNAWYFCDIYNQYLEINSFQRCKSLLGNEFNITVSCVYVWTLNADNQNNIFFLIDNMLRLYVIIPIIFNSHTLNTSSPIWLFHTFPTHTNFFAEILKHCL